MLYFSKLKIVTIYFIIVILSIFSFSNIVHDKNSIIFSKKVNLGLDLQGGSYLLLEVDAAPLIKQKLQNKLLNLRKVLQKNEIKYKNLKIFDDSISFQIPESNIKKFDDLFLDKEGSLNSYYNKYSSYEMNYTLTENLVLIKFTKFGINSTFVGSQPLLIIKFLRSGVFVIK